MNYTTNDQGQQVIAIGAPDSLARIECETSNLNLENWQRFKDSYYKTLETAVTNFRQEYAWPVSDVPMVANKMLKAVLKGTFNKDSRAFKDTCKELGIAHTYKAINAFIRH